jgi:acyl-coenzyme A thioesterase PaaI-like protein
MHNQLRVPIPKPQGHGCFACGTENPRGLKLDFYYTGEEVCSDITLDRFFEGWGNVAHGGILSTLLDEVMSWTVIYLKRVFFFTRKMEIKYIKPVLVGTELTVKGRLEDDSHKRLIKVKGEIVDKAGKLLTKGSGKYGILSEDQFSSVSQKVRQEMNQLFSKLPPL